MREARSVAQDVDDRKINTHALKPVLDELSWSIEADRAAADCIPELIPLINRACSLKSPNAEEIIRLMTMVINRLSVNYRDRLRDWIVDLLDRENSKIELLASAGFLSSHLINDGYSRLFLLNEIEERFFTNDIKSISKKSVSRFIDGIADSKRSYKVVSEISGQTARILNNIGGWNIDEFDDLPIHVQKEVATWKKSFSDSKYITILAYASDPFKAGEEVDARLSKIKSEIVVASNRIDISWSLNCYVFKQKSKSGIPLEGVDESIARPSQSILSGRRLREVVSLPNAIARQFDDKSAQRIARALSTAAVAYETNVVETRIISIWSAFEVLLGDPPSDGPRIKYFSDLMVPCSCLRYHRRLFSAVHEQLAVSYRKKYRNILKSVECDWSSNPHTKLVRLITIPEYASQRSSILKLCSHNPLALHRLFRLHKFYGNPASSRLSMMQHHERVMWQVNRIYRARNNIVHAGNSPPYLDSLVQNSVDYLRSSIFTIVKRSVKTGPYADVSQVVSEIGFEWQAQLEMLARYDDRPFSEGLVRATFAAL
jgi:hypothetical protein